MKNRNNLENSIDEPSNNEIAYVGARAEVLQLMEQRDKMQKQV